MSGRFRLPVAVYGVLLASGRVLLMRRAGSGYRDGQLGLPSGHIEGSESLTDALVRELNEELSIVVDPSECHLATVVHRAAEAHSDNEYLDLIFIVQAWTGVPAIGEPHKCTELVWCPVDNLAGDVIDYVAAAIQAATRSVPLLVWGWPEDRPAEGGSPGGEVSYGSGERFGLIQRQ